MKYSGERFLPAECKGEIAVEHYQRYQLACQVVSGKIVLDAACGEGYGSSLLAQHAKKVIGLDIDALTVESASVKYGNEKLSFVTGSIERLPFKNSYFDVVISYETIEHVDSDIQHLFLKEIKRVLKPDGILVMSTPNKAVYTDKVSGHNQFHIKEFYAEEYIDFLHVYFTHVEKFCQFPDVGYFITGETGMITAVHNSCLIDNSRYIIAVCSDQKAEMEMCPESFTYFDDSMYYTLYATAHRLENELLCTKQEADAFQAKLENDISAQKQCIVKLENERTELVDYVAHLEKDIMTQKEYIIHLENDIKAQKEYIIHLQNDLQAKDVAIAAFNEAEDSRGKYIQRLEKDIVLQKDYVSHLEHDLTELAQYTRHLETDIRTLNERIQKVGGEGSV